jgi:hypothetical protein
MPKEEQFQANPQVSEDFKFFEEFCGENTGRELAYLEVVAKTPLEMDPITIAFSIRHLIRLNRQLMDILLESLSEEPPPELSELLGVKGIQLDKAHAPLLRDVVFAFRDSPDDEQRFKLVRALQLMTVARERHKVSLTLGESYVPPDEGWTLEDFGGDDLSLETVRSIEDPRFVEPEEG